VRSQRLYFRLTLVISVLVGIILPLAIGVKDPILLAIFFSLVWFIYAVILVIVYFLVIGRRSLKRSKEMINEKWGYS
jgi:heme/copper-type cytochrome/quinol oxidase subunit 2